MSEQEGKNYLLNDEMTWLDALAFQKLVADSAPASATPSGNDAALNVYLKYIFCRTRGYL